MTPPHDKSSNASAISQYIDALPMFTDLTERERGILAGVFQCRRVDHGHELCREGDRGQSFFIDNPRISYLSPATGNSGQRVRMPNLISTEKQCGGDLASGTHLPEDILGI